MNDEPFIAKKIMRLVATSDLHADRSTLGIPRFDEVRRAVWESVDHAVSTTADAYLCLGDVADPDNGGATIRAMELLIEVAFHCNQHGIVFIIVAGNHDTFTEASGATVLSPLAAAARANPGSSIVVAEQPCLVKVAGAVILCLPFTSIDRTYDPDVEARRLLRGVTEPIIVASHLTELPGVSFGDEADMPRGRNVCFPIEATDRAVVRLQGHWHRRQVVDVGSGVPVQIPGSPARFTHGEEDHEPSFLVVNVPTP